MTNTKIRCKLSSHFNFSEFKMFTKNQTSFIKLVEEKFGKEYVISRPEVINIQKENNIGYPAWLMTDDYRVGRGMFKVPSFNFNDDSVMENVVPMKKHVAETSNESLIPEKDPNFEKFGFYNDLKNIIKSKVWMPTYIYSNSGFGKTYLVQQICAELKRECVRINFSTETSQDDLIGANTLIDGNIVFQEGPVLTALRLGQILLLDEIDRSQPNNLLILNSILEGKCYYNPKTKELIKAKEGFNVVVTANTRGSGSDDGKYLAQILDSAFLERFVITFEQPFPPTKVETKILLHYTDDNDFVEKLVKWSDVIRKTFSSGGVDELISTRRLVHIVQVYNMFNNKLKAIELCCSRYEDHVKSAFLDLYKKVDAGILLDENGILIEENELKQEPEF